MASPQQGKYDDLDLTGLRRYADIDLTGLVKKPEEIKPKVEEPKEEAGFVSRTMPALEGLGHFAKNMLLAGAFPHSTTPESQQARMEIGEGAIAPFKELGNTERMTAPEGSGTFQKVNTAVQGFGENIARFGTGMFGADYEALDEDVQAFQKDPSWKGAGAIAGDVVVPAGVAALTHYGPKAVKGLVGKYGRKPAPNLGIPTNVLHDQPQPQRQIAYKAGITTEEATRPFDRPLTPEQALDFDRVEAPIRTDRLLPAGRAVNPFIVSPEGTVARAGDLASDVSGLSKFGEVERAGELRKDVSAAEGAQVPEFRTEHKNVSIHPADALLDRLIKEKRITDLQANTVREWLSKYDDIRQIPEKFHVGEELNRRTRERNQKLLDIFVEAKKAMHESEASLGYPHNIVPRRFIPETVASGLPEGPYPNRPAFSLEPSKMGELPGNVVVDKGLTSPIVENRPSTFPDYSTPRELSPIMEAAPDTTPLIEKVRNQPEGPARSKILARLEAEEAAVKATENPPEKALRTGTPGKVLADVVEPIHETNVALGDHARELRKGIGDKLGSAIDSLPNGSIKDALTAQASHLAKEIGPVTAVKNLLFASGERQLKKLGPAGERLSKLLKDNETAASARGGRHVSKFHEITDALSKEDKKVVSRLVAGQEVVDASPAARTAHTKIKDLINTISGESASSGKPGEAPMLPGMAAPFEKFTAELFPDKMKAKFIEKVYSRFKGSPTDFYNSLVKSGIPENEALVHIEGFKKMGEAYVETPQGQKLLKGLEQELSLNVIEQHLYDTARETETNTRFGSQITGPDSPISKLMESMSPEERKVATDVLNSYLGRGEAPHRYYTKAASMAVNFEVATKLTSFMIKNINDMYTVVRDGGYARTLSEIGKNLRDSQKSKASATQAGAFEIFHHNLLDDPTFGNTLGKLYGMEAVETFIRKISANVGKATVEAKFNQLKANPKNAVLRKELTSFLEHPIDSYLEKGRLTPEDLDFAGGRFVEATSGKPNALSLPQSFFAQNPLTRLPLLFRRFAFTASKNMKDSFVRTATREAPIASAKASAAKLARTMSASIILGELTGDTVAAIKAMLDPDEDMMEAIANRGDLRGRVVADMMQSWLFGLVGDAAKAASGGLMSSLKFMGGPVASDVGDVATGIGNLAQARTEGGQKRSAKTRWGTIRNWAARNVPVPVLGPAIGSLIATSENKPNKYVPPPPKPPNTKR